MRPSMLRRSNNNQRQNNDNYNNYLEENAYLIFNDSIENL